MSIPLPVNRIETHLNFYSLSANYSPVAYGEIKEETKIQRILPEKSSKSKESLEKLTKLLEDVKWCWMNATLSTNMLKSVSPFPFHREYVHKNIPCIFEMHISSEKWDNFEWKQLLKYNQNENVRVNCTPTGRGDSIVFDPKSGKKVFVQPEERQMKFSDYLEWLLSSKKDFKKDEKSVYYLSAQNDSLRDEFSSLISDGFAPDSLPFGDELFGKKCDAVNLWIGNEKAVSCVHRDISYENLYCVVKGTKVFHLLPPCVAPFIGEKLFQNAKYCFVNNQWTIELEDEGNMTPWIEIDIAESSEKCCKIIPEFEKISELVQRVEIKAGQVLYLPAGWFHRVTQTEPTIAVNYWYDREFNSTWAMTEAIENLVISSTS